MLNALDWIANHFSKGSDAGTFGWHTIQLSDARALRNDLVARSRRLSPASARKHLSALRGVLRQCAEDDPSNTVILACLNPKALKAIPGRNDDPRGRALTNAELAALDASCLADGATGARDRAMIALLFGGGLRRAEAADALLSDYDPAGNTVLVRRGKGSVRTRKALPNSSQAAMLGWISVRGISKGPFLYRSQRGGLVPEPMTGDAIYQALERRANAAGVERVMPHDGRRTVATSMLALGHDLRTVQKALAHADIATTARYDRRLADTAEDAIRSMPYPSA